MKLLLAVHIIFAFVHNSFAFQKSLPKVEFFSERNIDSLKINVIRLDYKEYCSEIQETGVYYEEYYQDHSFTNECGVRYGFHYSFNKNGTISFQTGKSDGSSVSALDVYRYVYENDNLKPIRLEYELEEVVEGAVNDDREGRDERRDRHYSYYENGLLKSSNNRFYIYNEKKYLIACVIVEPKTSIALKNLSYEDCMAHFYKNYTIQSIMELAYRSSGDTEISLTVDGVDIRDYLLEKRNSKANYVVFEVATNQFIFHKINRDN